MIALIYASCGACGGEDLTYFWRSSDTLKLKLNLFIAFSFCEGVTCECSSVLVFSNGRVLWWAQFQYFGRAIFHAKAAASLVAPFQIYTYLMKKKKGSYDQVELLNGGYSLSLSLDEWKCKWLSSMSDMFMSFPFSAFLFCFFLPSRGRKGKTVGLIRCEVSQNSWPLSLGQHKTMLVGSKIVHV